MRSFTLTELLVIVIIVGILASFAMPTFTVTQERAFDNEARANLKLLQAAQRIYAMRNGGNYYPRPRGVASEATITTINNDLRLFLPNPNPARWNYLVRDTGCSQAQRNVVGGRTWALAINDADDEPDAGVTCP